MNAKILLAVAIAVMVWGVVALFYGEALTGAVLLAAGIALAIFSQRHKRGG